MVTRSAGRDRLVTIVVLILLPLAGGALGGCAMFRKYDMAQIHQESAAREERNPVIFIHGFVGSKLRNQRTQESVWGRFMNAIKRGKTDDLALPIDNLPIGENRDELVPYAIYDSVAGVKFYSTLLDALQTVGGYHMGDIDDPEPGDTLFVYYYDWRRDNVEAAAGLARAIARIKERLKAPDLRFDIVAHSMGGLAAEYYLMYGAADLPADGSAPRVTWAGAPNLGKIVLVGTPLRGTMHAFRTLNQGFSRTMSPAVVFTMPSIYELLPREGRGHFVDPQGNPLDVDLYDARTWARYGWSALNPRTRSAALKVTLGVNGARSGSAAGDEADARLERYLQAALDRAHAFHTALDRGTSEESPVPVHVFGSDCIPTLDRAVLRRTPAGVSTEFDDEATRDRDARSLEKMILAPGDGTVTADSLLAIDGRDGEATGAARSGQAFASTFFFCETHGFLPANRGFQDNLFYVLFYSPQRPSPITTTSRMTGAR
jgi:pimeloyl-ACP methyl ester carboxylesterase